MARVSAALALLVGLAQPVHAQVAGQIQRTVRDAQGGVLPGVSLTLRNANTGVQRTTVSESDGTYRFAGLQPGTCEMKADLQGFATVAVDRLTVTIGLDLQQDISMALGATIATGVTNPPGWASWLLIGRANG